VDALLDAARRRWAELVDVPALRAMWDLLVTLRPVWRVLRAWVAMQLLDVLTQAGDMATPVPTIGGPLPGSLLWLVAIVVSIQMGRNKIWPGAGAARRTAARVVLLVLNTFAVLMTPLVLGQFPASGTYHDYVAVYDPEPGLMNNDQFVRNVYPYDSQGNPLTGVQLFDENGNPLNVATTFLSEDLDGDERASVAYPWLNGERRLFNVFPLPEREQPAWRTETSTNAWTSANPPAIRTPPLAVVPPAALPLAETDADAAERTEGEAEGSGDPSTGTRDADQSAGARAGTRRDSEKREGR